MKKLFFLLLLFSCPVWALVEPHLYVMDPACPKNAPFKRGKWHESRGGEYYTPIGNCISCDTIKALMLVDAKDCDLCPNRTVESVDTLPGFITSNYCRLKVCPPEKPFYEEDWNMSGCKNCQDKPRHIKKEECAQCPNMRWVADIGCVPDKPNMMYYSGEKLDVDGVEIHISVGSDLYIRACDPKEWQDCHALKTSEEECKKCPFTYMKKGFCYMNVGKRIKACPEGHVRNKCGFCISCDEIDRDPLSKEECEKCPNRKMRDHYCILVR